MTLSGGPSTDQRAYQGLPPINPSQQFYETGGTITPIVQMKKLRRERLNQLVQGDPSLHTLGAGIHVHVT